MRLPLAVALTLCAAGSAAGADEVRHYASGWPIALAEAACDGDEGCLTLLADCPPGTDGTCSAQVATCTRLERGGRVMETLCVQHGSPDDSRMILPRQDDWTFARDAEVSGRRKRSSVQRAVGDGLGTRGHRRGVQWIAWLAIGPTANRRYRGRFRHGGRTSSLRTFYPR